MRLTAMERRNFVSALWHGAFLALGMALTQPTTVVAAFVADLTGSTIWLEEELERERVDGIWLKKATEQESDVK